MIVPMTMFARANSERLPDKNVRIFCGKPLIEWAFLCGKLAKNVGEMYFCTDSPYYAYIAKQYNITVIMQSEKSCRYGRWGGPTAEAHMIAYFKQHGIPVDWHIHNGINAPLKRPCDVDGMIDFVDQNFRHITDHSVEIMDLEPMGSVLICEDVGDFKVKEILSAHTSRIMHHSGCMGMHNWDLLWAATDYKEIIFDDYEKGILKPEVIEGNADWEPIADDDITKNHPKEWAAREVYFYQLPGWAGKDIDDDYDWAYCEWAFKKYILKEGYYD